jgi:phenylpyruvate tautomerase PptA (4-oxalocrotonate tautomerase family)
MPLLSIETNQTPPQEQRPALLRSASELVAGALNKPERYVMVRFESNPHMLFAGSTDPLAFLQLKSIGLDESLTQGLSAALCELMEARLGVPRERIYIEFVDAPRRMWGYNGGTF